MTHLRSRLVYDARNFRTFSTMISGLFDFRASADQFSAIPAPLRRFDEFSRGLDGTPTVGKQAEFAGAGHLET